MPRRKRRYAKHPPNRDKPDIRVLKPQCPSPALEVPTLVARGYVRGGSLLNQAVIEVEGANWQVTAPPSVRQTLERVGEVYCTLKLAPWTNRRAELRASTLLARVHPLDDTPEGLTAQGELVETRHHAGLFTVQVTTGLEKSGLLTFAAPAVLVEPLPALAIQQTHGRPRVDVSARLDPKTKRLVATHCQYAAPST